MLGTNIKRPPVISDGKVLDVQEMFLTLQGEGPNAGEVSVFIRLGGCNLACDFCDTEFESFSSKAIDEIVSQAKKLSLNNSNKRVANLIVITGGEPMRQPIENLCTDLIAEGFKIQIETNGTIYRDLPAPVEIICSPKNTGHGYAAIRPDLLKRINAFKFIISANKKDYSEVAEVGQAQYQTPVFIQPMDEHDEAKNKANVELVKKLALEKGYRVSLQLHKIMNIQ